MTKKIIILGGGFAGLQAEKYISSKLVKDIDLKIIDCNKYTSMLPALPDIASGFLDEKFSVNPIKDLINPETELINDNITNINLEKNFIQSANKKYHYDILLIASGSVTNFFKFNASPYTYKLDSIENAVKIRDDFAAYLKDKDITEKTLVLCGAGYTGIETAFSLHSFAEKLGYDIKVKLIERNKDILPFLDEDEKKEILQIMEKCNFDLVTDSLVKKSVGRDIILKDGSVIKECFFIWSSGSKFSIENIVGNIKQNWDGRILVDNNLNVINYNNVWAAGDSAYFEYKNTAIRKAVNFAYYGGKKAGQNIARYCNGKKLSPFKPFDAGWVLPLHYYSVGRIFGKIKINGETGLRLHYLMCGIRNYSVENLIYFLKRAITLKSEGFMKNIITGFLFGGNKDASFALLLLRIFTGIGIATHGYSKVFESLDGFTSYVVSLGIPSFLAPVAAISEFFGGICLVLGFFSRFWALFIAVTMGVAVFVAHNGQSFAKKELALFYLVVSCFFVLKGAGKWGVDNFVMKNIKK